MNRESYTSASAFPSKILHQKVIRDGKIIPLHIQLSPTNDCNLNCSFCSCADRDKKKQLSLEQIIKIICICAQRGAKAMTITGGGEPLLHPDINKIINYASGIGIKSGLVTNGILLNRLDHHEDLIWCRISSADDRVPSFDSIIEAIKINPKTDWAFSHVISRNPNYQTIRNIIYFANEHKFTHVRLVSDLCDLDNVPSMGEVASKIRNSGVEDSKVIYQGRKDSTKGTKNCYISLLKPVIAPEGIFPCCGIQYAIHGQPRDMIDELKMGDLKDLPEILDKQKHFDGSICDICYYNQYNQILSLLKERNIKHANFV